MVSLMCDQVKKRKTPAPRLAVHVVFLQKRFVSPVRDDLVGYGFRPLLIALSALCQARRTFFIVSGCVYFQSYMTQHLTQCLRKVPCQEAETAAVGCNLLRKRRVGKCVEYLAGGFGFVGPVFPKV